MLVNKVSEVLKKLDIVDATLLSVEEALSKLSKSELEYNEWWWLKSSVKDSDHIPCIVKGTNVVKSVIADHPRVSVRPALVIKNVEELGFSVGDKFIFDNRIFRIISNDIAFCMSDIGLCAYSHWSRDANASDYSQSVAKEYIDNWFNRCLERINKDA